MSICPQFIMDSFLCAACKAKEAVTDAHEIVETKTKEVKGAAGEYTMGQLKKALEGSTEQVGTAPDVFVTILEVKMQDGLQIVDLLNFSITGLKCRVRLEVKGTATQLAGMVAADTAHKVAGFATAAGLSHFGIADKLQAGAAGLKDTLHGAAKDGQEVKSVEFDVNLDLGVRKAGEEVSSVVHIAKGAFDEVDKVIPISKATKYVENAIAEKVKEIIRNWAKKKAASTATKVTDKAKDVATTGLAKLGLGPGS